MSAPTHQTRRNRNAALAKLLAALNVCRAAGIAIDLVQIATAPDYLHIIVANTYLDADAQKLLVGPAPETAAPPPPKMP
jgi:hypothetical protein